jgi:hypothetical protein
MREHSTRRLRAPWIPLVLATAAAMALSLSLTAGSTAAPHGNKHGKTHKAKKRKAKARRAVAPVSGIYDACTMADGHAKPPHDCASRLTAMRAGGFQVVLNYWSDSMSVEDNLAYADLAQSLGMKVIWNLANYDRAAEVELELVRATSTHPATWGYYIGDEERPDERPQVAHLSGAVRSLTGKPLLYVSRPNPSLMKPFRKLADYVGPDSYPHGPFDPPTCQTARWASKLAPRNPVMVLQAYSWSIDYPDFNPDWPGAGEMRQMRNQAVRCGRPRLIMWFCFHCITDYNPNPDAYWRDVAWAANGVNLGSTYRVTSLDV